MFNNQMFQCFVSGFLSAFRLGTVPTQYVQTLDIAEYFCKIENDINKVYQELKENERN